ncbi:amino acid adenylation domain-containing protein [Aquabacterium sp. A7-Y]|uniref:amino acid adenylation domain-containing protein n=1 Tax=Aquabacterium sp. A7-Y TaxID=1349605 RepID=UPI00223E2839|nr:amino acid adenylation domain-containing protein [Aquabacterium sp. A7-Y]MCW7539441.1 amino acid adenylation domain-containing protein [Aquabacterium sp. A7-Y]
MRLPLTQAQLGLWLGQQIDPSNPAYRTTEAVELLGRLDVEALQAAAGAVLAETEALQMRFHGESDGERLQVWQTPAAGQPTVPPLVDLADQPDAWGAARRWIAERQRRPIDLACGPLFETALLRLAAERHLWVLSVHHIALDGYGHALLARRVAERYAAPQTATAGRPPAARRFADVVDEDRAEVDSAASLRARDFWLDKLRGAARPAATPLGHGARRAEAGLDAHRFGALRRLAEAQRADWSTCLLAATAAWWQRVSGEARPVLGVPVMGRLGSAALSVPCMAMNIVPLPLAVDGRQSFAELLKQTTAEWQAARVHQRYRHERLREDLGLGRGERLFGPVVNLMPFDRPARFGALQARVHRLAAGPVEDLSVGLIPGADGALQIEFEANPNAYDAAALDTLRDSYLQALAALTERPALPLQETLEGVARGLRPARSVLDGGPLRAPGVPVFEAFAEQARRHPARTAIEHEGEAWSYGDLLAAVQGLAARLRAAGVRPADRVAIALPRGAAAVTAMLAAWWAGAAYLPLDPEGPPVRLQAMLDDARPVLAVCDTSTAALLHGRLPVLRVEGDRSPREAAETCRAVVDAPAYVLYTSGTTGRPRGVVVGHRALAHFVAGATRVYGLSPADRVLQFAPLHFDASVEEIFGTLSVGATLVVRSEAMLESVPALLAGCARHGVTVLDLPTAYWHELAYAVDAAALGLPASLRLVIIGGEAALPERVARWRARVGPGVTLLNTYGPTETTVICTTAVLAGPQAPADANAPVTIGRPLPGVEVAVVDERLEPLPPGSDGELCVLGAGLADGYLGQPEATTARFVELDTGAGPRRAYRTGDRVRLGPEGQLHYLGRLDDEFKLSGLRIDPAEVETALLGVAGVREAAVVGQSLGQGVKRLAAFVVGDLPLSELGSLRSQLLQRLPAPAVPTAFERVERLPRNANGKIDRRALRERLLALPQPLSPVEASPREQAVLAVWQEVLGLPGLSGEADFFALGGRSLQAIQVAARLMARLGHEVPVSLLFKHPTAAALAQALAVLDDTAPPPVRRGADALAPVFTIQPRRAGDTRPILFCLPPAEGLAWCYLGLSRHLGDLPIVGLQASGLSEAGLPEWDQMLDAYAAHIRDLQPHGPYRLLGWSSGGVLAHALACRLQTAGQTVELLALIDSYPPEAWGERPAPQLAQALEALLDITGDALPAGGLQREPVFALLRRPGSPLAHLSEADLDRLSAVTLNTMRQFRVARTPRFVGDVLFFQALQAGPTPHTPRSWNPYLTGSTQVVPIDSTHVQMTAPAPLAHIAAVLAHRLNVTVRGRRSADARHDPETQE